MENDQYLKISNENELQANFNYYKPDYDNQNIEKSKAYQKWYKTMKENNKNDVLCKCPFDKIYYFNNFICPICKKKICNYCLNPFSKYSDSSCCIRRRLKENQERGLKAMNRKVYELESRYHKETVIFFLIPGVSLVFFIGAMTVCLYYKINMKNSINNDDSYLDFITNKKSITPCVFMGLNILIAVLLAIPLLIYNICFNLFSLFLLLILDKCNICPYMFFVGFIQNDWLTYYENYL
jgi:hypothetical protein